MAWLVFGFIIAVFVCIERAGVKPSRAATQLDRGQTAYAVFSRRRAQATLLALGAIIVACVATTQSPTHALSGSVRQTRPGDNELYWAVADRVARGEGYYHALGQELDSRGYPTRSVFNWRTPLPIWLIGHLPHPELGRLVLSLLGLMVIALGTALVWREEQPGIGRAVLTAVLLVGPLLLCGLRGLYISLHELWAGVLIALSVCAYGLSWRRLAVGAGLLAPFLRDLAVPYPILCGFLAWREHRYKEVAIWLAGLLSWAVFFGVHCYEVMQAMPADARAHQHSWIQFGGLAFLISATQVNCFLLALPRWAAAVYFVAAMFGLAGWHTPAGRRTMITVSAYALLFSVVGQPFNMYWGLIIAPLLCFGVARFPASLRDLCCVALRSAGHPALSQETMMRSSTPDGWRLVDGTTGIVVVPQLMVADRFFRRFAGLQFRQRLPQGAALLLVPCNSVHTCFVRFPLDLVCLGRDGRVLEVRKQLRPWRAAMAPKNTHAILEVPAGDLDFAVGQRLAIQPPRGAALPRSLRFLALNG